MSCKPTTHAKDSSDDGSCEAAWDEDGELGLKRNRAVAYRGWKEGAQVGVESNNLIQPSVQSDFMVWLCVVSSFVYFLRVPFPFGNGYPNWLQ